MTKTTCSASIASFLELPEDVWRHVALHLSAPELFSLLSVHRRIHEGLGSSSAFWKDLVTRDSMLVEKKNELGAPVPMEQATYSRRDYLIRAAYPKHLPTVEWHSLNRSGQISAREGHLACVLTTGTEDRICVTGGYADDATVYLMHVPHQFPPQATTPTPTPSEAQQQQQQQQQQLWSWSLISPTGARDFVYGASLTSLDGTRAVRFGGFRAGGYSGETNEVAVLTVEGTTTNGSLQAEWKHIPVQNSQFAAQARAYHTATLLAGRYLVIVGGMMARFSILSPAILDTQTWTWLDSTRIIDSGANLLGIASMPSGRHGHSMILDQRRNRFVLFGGGTGTDLLRSGRDNAEVWEMKLGNCWETNLEASFPWTWSQLHGGTSPSQADETNSQNNEGAEEDHTMVANQTEENNENTTRPVLSASEELCLGRCHNGIHIAPDTAILLFGSGRPSTNGVIAYDLSTDSFLRPDVRGPLPRPRFTFCSAFLPRHGYLICHGGFSSQEGDAISDMNVLDVAPYVSSGRRMDLPTDRTARSYPAVSDEDAQRAQDRGDAVLYRMMETLSNAQDGDRQELAANMLGQLIANGHSGGRSFALMNMVANGSAVLQFGDDDVEDEDDEDDDDYEDSDDAMGGVD